MERYEVRVKFEEIKRLADKRNYQAAMEVADTVDWDRVKNMGMLCQVGEIYERCRYYEDSKAIYERAYRLQPQSRVTIYRLANVSVKLKDFDDAEEYLEEYRNIVPYDPNVLVLTYKIRKGQGAELTELISILENLKDKDYHEKWAYELAVLYAEADEEEKCAKECDNIFLWFGEGRYVQKALKLKSLFRTLTTEQDRYLKTATSDPVGAAETMERGDAAVKETAEKQKEFMQLQKEVGQIDAKSESGMEKVRDMEDAREMAINASREAKAAELLNEAMMEKQMEEEIVSEKEEQEMLGETKFPTFNLPIMDVLKAPVWKNEQAETNDNVPGMEFIDISSGVEEPESAATAEPEMVTKSESIEEARERILSYGRESDSDLQPDTYDIKEEISEPADEPEEAQNIQYTNMEELLTHADEMKSDDLANSLAMILSGKVEEEEEVTEPEYDNPARKLQNVINRIWTRSATKKPAKVREYEPDPEIDNIEIKHEAPNRYDTLNLQKDLANSISHILNATEKDEIEKTIAVMDRSMIKSNISKYTATSEEPAEETKEEFDWEAELGDVISEDTRKKIQEYDMFDSLEQEVDGQIKLLIEEVSAEETDIPGQINIEDYLFEQEQEQLEEAKMRAIKIAGEYMEQVSIAAPMIAEEEAQKYLADSQKELLERARALMESTTPDQEEIDSVMKSLAMMIAYANETVGKNTQAEVSKEKDEESVSEALAVLPEETILADVSDEADVISELEEAEESEDSGEAEEIAESEETEVEPVSMEEETVEAAETETVVTPEEIQIEDIRIDLPESIAAELLEVPEVSEETLEMMSENKKEFMDSISDVSAKEIEGIDKAKASKQVIPISDEQMDIMDYFMNVPEIENQIVDFIENQHNKFENIIICGKTGSGRASLALRLYKSIRLNNPDLPNQTLKVDADALNKKSVLKVYEKISNGIIIIEHAGLLNEVAVCELEEAMKKFEGKIFTIIIGTEERINALMENHKTISNMCKYKFVIPEYNQDQYVDFAKSYAYSYGYVIEDMALLALYSELSAIKTKNKIITLQDVKLIINDAILNNEKKAKKIFGGIFSVKKDREGNIILREKDFVI